MEPKRWQHQPTLQHLDIYKERVGGRQQIAGHLCNLFRIQCPSRLQPATYLHSIISQKWLDSGEVPVQRFWSIFILVLISITCLYCLFFFYLPYSWTLKCICILQFFSNMHWRNVLIWHRKIFSICVSHKKWNTFSVSICLKFIPQMTACSFLWKLATTGWMKVMEKSFIVVHSNLQYISKVNGPGLENTYTSTFLNTPSHLLLSAAQSSCSSVIILWGVLWTYLWPWFPEIIKPNENLPKSFLPSRTSTVALGN